MLWQVLFCLAIFLTLKSMLPTVVNLNDEAADRLQQFAVFFSWELLFPYWPCHLDNSWNKTSSMSRYSQLFSIWKIRYCSQHHTPQDNPSFFATALDDHRINSNHETFRSFAVSLLLKCSYDLGITIALCYSQDFCAYERPYLRIFYVTDL